MTASSSEVVCPHCQLANPGGSAFCGGCGKALPYNLLLAPRVVEEGETATTEIGRELQSLDLLARSRKGAGALLFVAIVQTVLLVIVYFSAVNQVKNNPSLRLLPGVFIALGGIVVLFWGLWWWARRNPFPAAIVGLVVYLTLQFVSALANPKQFFQSIPLRAIFMLVIVIVLVRAIQTGAEHRRLVRQKAAEGLESIPETRA